MSTRHKMITINKPKIKVENGKAILTCKVFIDDKKEEIFYEIDEKYKDYLCTERSDAFVIAAFYYAMKHHHDITCEVPITSSVYHNLTTYLIPTLAKHSNNLSEITLHIPVDSESLKSKGEVGTGMSCGIDSMHTLKNYLDPKCSDMKLTCLCLNNVGSFKAYDERYRGIGSDNARGEIIKRAEKVAKEVNLPLIVTDSNVHKVFNDAYFRVHTFANMFSVFLMQKFFSKYFYASSGYDLSHYNVIDSHGLDSAEYDLLTFFSLETPNLKVYPEGNEKTRLEKTIDLADFDLARNNLHVCIKDSHNCGKCLKCRRTLLSLEAIGKLDNFKNVFDIDYYEKHKDEYYEWLKKEVSNESLMNTMTSELLKQKEGDIIYQDIEEYNKNNVIIPEVDIDSVSVKKDSYVLNKNSNILYKNNLYYRLFVCLKLASLKDKEIDIPKYLLDNVKVYYKNQKTLKKKCKYIKIILGKRTRKVNLHELIYFILYKPSTSKNIIKFLEKAGYLEEVSLKYLLNYSTTYDLVDLFDEVLKNDVLKKILEIDTVKVRGKNLKNENIFKNCKDIYYRNDEYKETFLVIDNDMYYFVGNTGGYTVSIISKYKDSNTSIYEDSMTIYGLIKKISKY